MPPVPYKERLWVAMDAYFMAIPDKHVRIEEGAEA